ncbi:MAG TPA: glycosyltransferase, partial [Acidimicrobiales bacterium]|nr:glycosyltransferase [Acidimicrobiales bacterium]
MTPRVRAVLVNFNGGVMIERAVAHVLATQWPAGSLEVVVVDNASADGSADRVSQLFPQVQLRRSSRNLGFAGGTNLGLLDLREVDHVALVNSDAFVSPGWLQPLVEALESDPAVGAACPKILFAPRFVELELRAEPHVPGGNDPRTLGVRLSGVRAGGQDGWQWVNFVQGFYWPETDHAVPAEPPFRWSGPRAGLWAPVPGEAEPTGVVELRLSSDLEKQVEITSGGEVTRTQVGREAKWVAVAAPGPLFDVLNNAG